MMIDILTRVQANGDFVMSEDGLYYFWPTQNNGMYSASDLAEIADELNRRNQLFLVKDDDAGC